MLRRRTISIGRVKAVKKLSSVKESMLPFFNGQLHIKLRVGGLTDGETVRIEMFPILVSDGHYPNPIWFGRQSSKNTYYPDFGFSDYYLIAINLNRQNEPLQFPPVPHDLPSVTIIFPFISCRILHSWISERCFILVGEHPR